MPSDEKSKAPWHMRVTALLVAVFLLVSGIVTLAETQLSFGKIFTAPFSDVDLESALNNAFPGLEFMVDINGLKARLMNQHTMQDSRYNLVKDKEKYLLYLLDEYKITDQAYNVSQFQQYTTDKGADFLYLSVPYKTEARASYLYPGMEDFSGEGRQRFVAQLQKYDVPLLDMGAMEGMESAYYRTDHHWRVETALTAALETIAALEAQGLDLSYDDALLNTENYEYRTEENVFLGSQGRRTGSFYSGKDDFTFVIPSFETSLHFQRMNNGVLEYEAEGSFEDALLSEPVDTGASLEYYDSYLALSRYESYIHNNMVPNNKKVMIVGDSYARPFAAFISLFFQDCVVMDVQEDRYTGDLFEFADSWQPDAVLMLFSGDQLKYEAVYQFSGLETVIPKMRKGKFGEEKLDVAGNAEAMYQSLLKSLLSLGAGQNTYEKIDDLGAFSHQVICKLLSAETARYEATAEPQDADIAGTALQWLLDHADDNEDGVYGYGLIGSGDAMGDGLTSHSYGTQNSAAFNALLGVLQTDLPSEAQRILALDIMREICLNWCNNYWQTTDDGGYFCYSESVADNFDSPNVSAQLIGAFSQLIGVYPEIFTAEEQALIQGLLDDGVTRLMNTMTLENGVPVWPYVIALDELPNDIVHQVMIMEGLDYYTKYVGNIPLSFTEEQALAYIYESWDSADKLLNIFPAFFDNSKQARLVDLAAGIEYLAANGDGEMALSLLTSVFLDYGEWPTVLDYPANSVSGASYNPVGPAFLLSSMAFYIYTNEELYRAEAFRQAENIAVADTDALYQSMLEDLLNDGEHMDTYSQLDALWSNSHQEICKLLLAETARYNATSDARAADVVRTATQWLLDHADDNKDGVYGYGLIGAWDAMQDGTVNPANHPYGVQNAIAIMALTGALKTGLPNKTQQALALEVMAGISLNWCRNYWQPTSDGGYFWYSESTDDNFDSPNVSAQLIGAFSQLTGLYPKIFTAEEYDLIRSCMDNGVKRLMSTMTIQNDMPVWPYVVVLDEQPNDVVHQMMIMEGLDYYLTYGGQIPIAFSRKQSLAYIYESWDDIGKRLYRLPLCFGVSYQVRLSDLGAAVEYLAVHGEDKMVVSLLASMLLNYGKWPKLVGSSTTKTFLLMGIAAYLYK